MTPLNIAIGIAPVFALVIICLGLTVLWVRAAFDRDRLAAELARLTDRDARGRFERKEPK